MSLRIQLEQDRQQRATGNKERSNILLEHSGVCPSIACLPTLINALAGPATCWSLTMLVGCVPASLSDRCPSRWSSQCSYLLAGRSARFFSSVVQARAMTSKGANNNESMLLLLGDAAAEGGSSQGGNHPAASLGQLCNLSGPPFGAAAGLTTLPYAAASPSDQHTPNVNDLARAAAERLKAVAAASPNGLAAVVQQIIMQGQRTAGGEQVKQEDGSGSDAMHQQETPGSVSHHRPRSRDYRITIPRKDVAALFGDHPKLPMLVNLNLCIEGCRLPQGQKASALSYTATSLRFEKSRGMSISPWQPCRCS